jgi:hypothetical protein
MTAANISLLYDRLFQPHSTLKGILRCALCSKLFVSKSQLLTVRKLAKGQLRWPEEFSPRYELKRRIRHGLYHLKKRQCKRAPSGVFFIPKTERPTARQHGFI